MIFASLGTGALSKVEIAFSKEEAFPNPTSFYGDKAECTMAFRKIFKIYVKVTGFLYLFIYFFFFEGERVSMRLFQKEAQKSKFLHFLC